MKHVSTPDLCNPKQTAAHGGCGECQTSCQSACKTSCTVANQKCEHAGQSQISNERGRALGAPLLCISEEITRNDPSLPEKASELCPDVNSGAVHLLDDISYAVSGLIDENMTEKCPESVVEALPQYAADDVREAYGELYELKKAGQLFAEDDYIDVSRYIPVGAPVKALCLHVAHDCNLRCKYCFASTGDFGQTQDHAARRSRRRRSTSLSRVSGKRRNIEVDFFGGEPLMAWDTVTQTVDYARSIEGAARQEVPLHHHHQRPAARRGQAQVHQREHGQLRSVARRPPRGQR